MHMCIHTHLLADIALSCQMLHVLRPIHTRVIAGAIEAPFYAALFEEPMPCSCSHHCLTLTVRCHISIAGFAVCSPPCCRRCVAELQSQTSELFVCEASHSIDCFASPVWKLGHME